MDRQLQTGSPAEPVALINAVDVYLRLRSRERNFHALQYKLTGESGRVLSTGAINPDSHFE